MIYLKRLRWALRKLLLPIKNNDLVVDIGSGGHPYPRSDILVDRELGAEHRNNYSLISDRLTILCDACNLPIKDKSIDYSVASHILEHMSNPEKFISELTRISNRGYIEVPSALFERLFPYNIHCLEIDLIKNKMIIFKKKKAVTDKFLSDFKYLDENKILGKYMYHNPHAFHVCYHWNKKINFKIINKNTDSSWIEKIYKNQNQDENNSNNFINSFTLRNLGNFLATQYYKLLRGRYRNLSIAKKILCCPKCKGELVFNTNYVKCLNCNSKYERKGLIFNFEKTL